MMPVVSAYTVLEVGETSGTRVGVGSMGVAVAAGGRRESEGGVGVGPSGGKPAAEVEVGNSSPYVVDRSVFRARSSKIDAA